MRDIELSGDEKRFYNKIIRKGGYGKHDIIDFVVFIREKKAVWFWNQADYMIELCFECFTKITYK